MYPKLSCIESNNAIFVEIVSEPNDIKLKIDLSSVVEIIETNGAIIVVLSTPPMFFRN